MKMRTALACSVMMLTSIGGAWPAAAQAVAESKQPQSSVSVLVEPQVNDGRLVVRIAAKNLGANAVPFGPAGVAIARLDGQPVPIYPLSSLIDDVRTAAGLPSATVPTTAPTQGAYAAPQQTVRDGGQLDVTGFTDGSTVGGDEHIRRSNSAKTKPSITAAEAESQIAALKQAILQDSMLGSGQVAAGQIVTDALKFGKKDDRTLHLRVRVAGEEHSFTIEAPKD